MKHIKTDICIIGAGSGGLSVAAGAVQMGAKVVLIEGHKMGGDCLNYGCVPSKAFIAAGKHAYSVTSGSNFGVLAQQAKINYEAVKNHVFNVIKAIEPYDSVERFEKLGVHVIKEFGGFKAKNKVQAGDYIITARRFVIATGSSPLIPEISGLDKVSYFTNETIFELKEQPKHLIIIGGGPIGVELAQAHIRLGARVTLIEGEKVLSKDDPEMVAVVLNRLRLEGVNIVENAIVTEISKTKNGLSVIVKGGGVYKGSHLLLAVGRKANIEKLNLAQAGIEIQNGAIKVNQILKTSNKKIYAIGDVIGGMQFTHVAGYHAGIIIKSALFGLKSKTSNHHIPRVTYTDPEIAQIGLTQAQATEKFGKKLEVISFNFSENDRAKTELITEGLIKLMVVKGRPVGVSIVGIQAGELIQIWALVFANKLKISAIANMVAPYPTFGEINKRVVGAYFSPRLFESNLVKGIVRLVQKF